MIRQNWLKLFGFALLALVLNWEISPEYVPFGTAVFAAEGDAGDAGAADADAGTADPAADSGGAGGADAAKKDAKADPKIPTTVLGLLINSGFFGYVIIILSVVLLAISIQTFMEYTPDKLMNEDVLAEIEETLDGGDYDAAIQICEEEDIFMTRIISAGLGKMANGFGRMEEAINEEAETQATFLHQRLGYINLIANLSPMLGLLGTVSGMVEAFKEIALNPTANAADLAGGIYTALTTTLLGLCVAIPGTVIFTFLRNRVVKIIMDQGVINGEILDRFRTEG